MNAAAATTTPTHAPEMSAWNLALRFGLELAALAAWADVARHAVSGPLGWIAAIAIPAGAAAAWVVFNVPGDPSRSGRAPVRVPGAVRLGLESLILGGAVVTLIGVGHRSMGLALGALVAVHSAASGPRTRWLLDR